MTIKEFAVTDMYKETAATQSKTFCFSFIIYCLYFMFFTQYHIGFWWIPIIIVGLFVSSLCFAMPYTLLIVKRMLSRQEYMRQKVNPDTINANDVVMLQNEIKMARVVNFVLSVFFLGLQFVVLNGFIEFCFK